MERNPLAKKLAFELGSPCIHDALADNAHTANKSNNPLNLAPRLNVQNDYTPKLYDTGVHTNDALLRGCCSSRRGFVSSATTGRSHRSGQHSPRMNSYIRRSQK